MGLPYDISTNTNDKNNLARQRMEGKSKEFKTDAIDYNLHQPAERSSSAERDDIYVNRLGSLRIPNYQTQFQKMGSVTYETPPMEGIRFD